MKINEFQTKIIKSWKSWSYNLESQQNIENLRIPFENPEIYENLEFPNENHGNHENHWIPIDNHKKSWKS